MPMVKFFFKKKKTNKPREDRYDILLINILLTVIVVSFKCLDYGFSAFSLYIFVFLFVQYFYQKLHSRRMNSWSVRKVWKKRQKKIIKVKCRHHWHIHKFNHPIRSVFWFYCINLHKYRSIDFNLWNNITVRWALNIEVF